MLIVIFGNYKVFKYLFSLNLQNGLFFKNRFLLYIRTHNIGQTPLKMPKNKNIFIGHKFCIFQKFV